MNYLIKCTVVESRYGGVYEGAEYLAFPLNSDELPVGWDGDDITCCEFWLDYKGLVGKGSTAKEAKTSLVIKLVDQE